MRSWAAFHPSAFATNFNPLAPLTLENFRRAWLAAPFARYFLNTLSLVLGIMAAQFVICTLAAFGLARWRFFGSGVLFALILVQLNGHSRRSHSRELPHAAVAQSDRYAHRHRAALCRFGVRHLSAASELQINPGRTRRRREDGRRRHPADDLAGSTFRWPVRFTLPTAWVSVSYHWNNFLWPLIVTNSGRDAAADSRLAGVRLRRSGSRLVGDLCGRSDDLGAPDDRLPAVPARLHPEFSCAPGYGERPE